MQHKLKARDLQSLPDGKHFDGDGLFLHVTDRGTKRIWRYGYRLGDSQRTYTIGPILRVSLPQARSEHEAAHKLVSQGIDPVADRRERRDSQLRDALTAEMFGTYMDAWITREMKARDTRWSADYAKSIRQQVALHLKPTALWRTPLHRVELRHIAQAMSDIQQRLPSGGAKLEARIRQALDSAVRDGLVPVNPLRLVGRSTRKAKGRRRHYPAIIDLDELGRILVAAERSAISRPVYGAHFLTAYCAVRLGEAIAASWNEFDLKAGTWTIPRSRMKVKSRDYDHQINLAPSVIAFLEHWPIKQGFLFPGDTKTGHVTLEAVEQAYRETLKLRDKHKPHSWRSALSTNANDCIIEIDGEPVRRFNSMDVEQCLDHEPRSEVTRSYDRGLRVRMRTAIWKWWATQLDEARLRALELPANVRIMSQRR